MEGEDVALQVEHRGVGAFTALPRAAEHLPHLLVDMLVLPQDPGVLEDLAAARALMLSWTGRREKLERAGQQDGTGSTQHSQPPQHTHTPPCTLMVLLSVFLILAPGLSLEVAAILSTGVA